jgi:hypothetical protein
MQAPFDTILSADDIERDRVELHFPEFVEFAVALAAYLDADPFVPLAPKVDAFCAHEVAPPPLRAKHRW